jgi:apolipoprotein N-acyltransferase
MDPARGRAIRAAVLQANIPQSLKWNQESLFPTLRAYVELTREAFGNEVIVWPETAIPEFLDRVRKPLLEPLAEEAREEGAQLVIGLPVLDHERQTYYNSLISLGKDDEDLYQKRHLVPFGEFMPLRSLLGPLAKAFQVPYVGLQLWGRPSGLCSRSVPIASGSPSATRMPSPPRWSRPCRTRPT